MAQPKILFYKGTSAPDASTYGIGTLWFDKTNRVLKVRIAIDGTSSDWEQYAGKIDDIQVSNGIMTIQKADGTNYTIDLSDVASAGKVKEALDALDAKITANTTAIGTKADQTALDSAVSTLRGDINTVSGNLAAEVTRAEREEARIEGKVDAMDTAYKAADTALDGRIDTLESQITGLNGTLHFRGVTDTVPADPAQGDFYITTEGVEYIYDGTKWEKIGDTSVESAAISALQGRMDTAEGDITALQTRAGQIESAAETLAGRVTANEQAIGTKADQTALDSAVSTLRGDINTVSGKVDTEKTRAEQAEEALRTEVGRINTIVATEIPSISNRIKAIEDLNIAGTYATREEVREVTNALSDRVSACESALTWSGFED